MMKCKVYELLNDGERVCAMQTVNKYFGNGVLEETETKISFRKLWGKLTAHAKTKDLLNLDDFIGNICSLDMVADIKCTLSSAPGEDYFVRFNGNKISVLDKERTLVFITYFDMCNDVSDLLRI